MKLERKNYNTTLRVDLIKKVKFLAVKEDARVNDLLEEAIEDLLKKYENKWWGEKRFLIGKIIDALAKINYITGTEESDGTAAADFKYSGNLKEGQPNIVEISITDYETGKDYKVEYNLT